MNAIEIRNLTKRFGDKTVVDHLNLDIREGELLALLGVNGAGKTTTIRMLTGLLPPDEGEARLLGKSILREAAEAKQFLAVSPQESAIAPKLTVEENLEFIAGIYGLDKATARAKSQQMLDDLSLRDYAKTRAKNLSGGWQRRLSIAMALITEPNILFLDEPTLGLDVLARRELWALVKDLKGRVTVILTTHYMEEAETLADRIAVMSRGQLKALGTAEELIAQTKAPNLEEAFVRLAQEGRPML